MTKPEQANMVKDGNLPQSKILPSASALSTTEWPTESMIPSLIKKPVLKYSRSMKNGTKKYEVTATTNKRRIISRFHRVRIVGATDFRLGSCRMGSNVRAMSVKKAIYP